MELTPLNAPSSPPLTDAPHAKQPADLKKACQQFESYFLDLMFKEMRKSIPKSTLLKDEGDQQQTFQELIDQKVSETMSDRGDFGLAKMMYTQLTREDIVDADGLPVLSPGVTASDIAGKSPEKPNAAAQKNRQLK
ncbi:MAG: rod-binding protein [Capsulimonas sp.]|uniref:rod-binding protein n=1 Tax=Capsulimonas sp. TaxID=2494211 RepID=UPI0032654485